MISYRLHTMQRFCPLHEEDHEESENCAECKRIREAGYWTDNSSNSDYGASSRQQVRKVSAPNDAMLRMPTMTAPAATVPRASIQTQQRRDSPFATLPHRRRHSLDSIESSPYVSYGDLPPPISPTNGNSVKPLEQEAIESDDNGEFNEDQEIPSEYKTTSRSTPSNGKSKPASTSQGRLYRRRHHYHGGHSHPHIKALKASSGSASTERESRFSGIAVCPDESIHQSYTKGADVIIPAHMSRVWNLLYGGADNFMKHYF